MTRRSLMPTAAAAFVLGFVAACAVRAAVAQFPNEFFTDPQGNAHIVPYDGPYIGQPILTIVGNLVFGTGHGELKPPVVSACGVSPVVTPDSTMSLGEVTVGSGAAVDNCLITMPQAIAEQECFWNPESVL